MSWSRGMALGIVGCAIGGLIFGGVSLLTGYLAGITALVSGAVTGVLFGYGTKGLSKQHRMLVGAILGFLSILFGYYLIYQLLEVPIEVGSITLNIKPSEIMDFTEFMTTIIEPKDLAFFAIGIGESATLSKRF
jgi:hypothetical protein